LVNLTVIALAFQGYVPVFVPIVFIFRDTIVDAYRMSVASLGVDVSAN
jgi:phosphatidylglycerophosphate synthase